MTKAFKTFVTGVDTNFSTELNSNFSFMAPIGTVVAWLKSYTNTPALPEGWLECNGQTVSDSNSVYNGQVVPNLNTGTQMFLRGSSTSGTTGGAETHHHGLMQATLNGNNQSMENYAAANHLPPYYEVVWIFRIK